MSTEKRIACFFTGGYTELNAMKSFFKKINPGHTYIQLCPIAPRKNKNAIRQRQSIHQSHSGLTGDALIQHIIEHVDTPKFKEEEYDAIIIEDDKDSRFLESQSDGSAVINLESWREFKDSVVNLLAQKGISVPVIFFFAAPEVEAWFISDWENSFGKAYSDVLTSSQNAYFSTVFRKHVSDRIITDRYSSGIENYGYFDGKYRKLSEELQTALDTEDFLQGLEPMSEHKSIRYSKRVVGGKMLECIDPLKVVQQCNILFREGFYTLKSI